MKLRETVNVPGKLSISAVQRLLDDLTGRQWDANLRLPTNIQGGHFTAYSLMLQLLMTWGVLSPPDRHVQTFVDSEDSARRLVVQDHGLLVLQLKHPVLSRRGKALQRDEHVRAATVERRHSMDAAEKAMRGTKLFVLAHGPHDRLPQILFRPGQPPQPHRTKHELERLLAGPLLQRLIPSGRRTEFSQVIKALATSLTELMDNTTRWATADPWRGTPTMTVRGLRFASHEFGHGAAGPGTPIHDYIMEFGKRGREVKRLLEVAVFDTGPTLAAWRLREQGATGLENVRFDGYAEAITWCLNPRHTTTSSTAPIGGGGYGLPLTLKQLDAMDAFVLLRTGPIWGMRNFLKYPLGTEEGSLTLHDWTTEPKCNLAEHPGVQGTLWSTLIPIEK